MLPLHRSVSYVTVVVSRAVVPAVRLPWPNAASLEVPRLVDAPLSRRREEHRIAPAAPAGLGVRSRQPTRVGGVRTAAT